MSDTVLAERRGRVGILTINRPKALNALNTEVMEAMVAAASEMDADREVGCIVLTGSERAFAAGADIKEMNAQSYMDMYYSDFFAKWDVFAKLRTPKIAAVNGFALGGGCELALMCDFIIASDTAKFGSPRSSWASFPAWAAASA